MLRVREGDGTAMALLEAGGRMVARLLSAAGSGQRAGLVARIVEAQARPRPVPIGEAEFVVFDLETTGLRPSAGDAICSIGAVRIRAGRIEHDDRFHTLVNPGRPIPRVATGFHGITDAMVAVAPRAPQALEHFREFVGDAVLVAHNAGFDVACLAWAHAEGGPPIGNPALCSMALSSLLDPHEPDHSLDGVATRAGIVIQGRHQALGDALATAQLALGLLNRAAARGVETVADLHDRLRMPTRLVEAVGRF